MNEYQQYKRSIRKISRHRQYLNSGPQFVAIPEFPAIGNQVGLKIEQYLRGARSLDETLKSSQDLIEKILRKSGYYDKK